MDSPNPAVGWKFDVLPAKTKAALTLLSHEQWLKKSQWYLAGGTALALQIGHRQSVDLDFFSPDKSFTATSVLRHFDTKPWTTEIARDDTIYGELCGGKVSFIAYPFFKPHEPPRWFGTVRVLAPQDIAVMKIMAISQRGRKRDFIDLYYYIQQQRESLRDIIHRVPDQYRTVTHDFHHLLKALMYFSDAEEDPMPQLLVPLTWSTVKAFFEREVPRLAKELLTDV